MKKTTLIVSAITCISMQLLTSCSTPAEKVESAVNEVTEAQKSLEKANEAYLVEIDQYKKEAAEKTAANDQSLTEFKVRIENEKKEAKEEYNKKIEALEKKNSDMKKSIADYKADGKENWEKFKTEFSRDMDELGSAFKDFTVKNKK
ncbi:MAG: peptidase M23 [Bacteroidota bacterium]|nr:peptidase M23 [Bacteroidota bacterium]